MLDFLSFLSNDLLMLCLCSFVLQGINKWFWMHSLRESSQ